MFTWYVSALSAIPQFESCWHYCVIALQWCQLDHTRSVHIWVFSDSQTHISRGFVAQSLLWWPVDPRGQPQSQGLSVCLSHFLERSVPCLAGNSSLFDLDTTEKRYHLSQQIFVVSCHVGYIQFCISCKTILLYLVSYQWKMFLLVNCKFNFGNGPNSHNF